MNVPLAHVISDIVGETGRKIVRAILAGECDGVALARMKNARIHASEADIAKAITATAHQLVCVIYTMLTRGSEYTDQGQDHHGERYRERVMHHLAWRARQLGFQLAPLPDAAWNRSFIQSLGMCVLRGITLTPAPTWRLTVEPADGDERHCEGTNVRDVDHAALGGVDEWNAANDENEVRDKDDPTLPHRRRAPAPTVALGGEPILSIVGRGHLRSLVMPLAIKYVALASGHALDVSRLHQVNLEPGLVKHLVQRDPVHAGGLHGQRRDLALP